MALFTAKEAKSMADENKIQFMNSFTMKRILRYIKKQASQGYYSCVKQVFKHDANLIKNSLWALGYQATIDTDDIYGEYYITISWQHIG